MTRAVLKIFLATALVFSSAIAANGGIVSLKVRPGASVDFLVVEPKNAFAAVVLFEGGGGTPDLQFPGGRGFINTSRNRFAENGLAFSLIDAPSDQRRFLGGMHPLFRKSEAHAKDIAAVVAWMKKKTKLPVWVVGISMGTYSAASYAVRGHRDIAGVVLLSSSTRPPVGGRGILDLNLDRIQVPLLAIAHNDDACPGTPPVGAIEIVRAAASSPNAKAKSFAGGEDAGRRPCFPETPHTFFRIEEEVISAIAKFIRANTKQGFHGRNAPAEIH